jgi:hypothetical protein
MRRTNLLLVLATALLLAFGAGCGDTTYVGVPGPAGPPGQDGQDGQDGGGAMADDGTSVEACIECHGENGAVPAFDIRDENDVHYIGDVNSDGRLTPSGYRQLNVTINSVDVTGANVVIDFRVTDEDGTGVDDIFADDGRFTISKLIPPGLNTNDPTMWQSLMNLVEDPGIVGDGPGGSLRLAASSPTTTAATTPIPRPTIPRRRRIPSICPWSTGRPCVSPFRSRPGIFRRATAGVTSTPIPARSTTTATARL